MKIFTRLSLVLVILFSKNIALTQEADSLIRLIKDKAIIDYTKETATMNYGSTYAIGDTLGYCISFVKQPNCIKIKPLVLRLLAIADTTDLENLTVLTRLLINQYKFVWWDTKFRSFCLALWYELPERKDQNEIVTSLQDTRLYLLLLKNFKGDDKQVFEEVMKSMKIKKYCYNLKYKTMTNLDSLACNRLESLVKGNDEFFTSGFDSGEIFYQNKTYNYYEGLLQSKFDDWQMYLKSEIYGGIFVESLSPNSNPLAIDRTFLDKIIKLAIANKSSFLNDYLIGELESPTTVKFTDGFYLLGTTNEKRVIPIISKYFEGKPAFFDESGDFGNYILGDYGKLYARQFFLAKFKEKLPKDKYLLAISAIVQVPDQEVVEQLNREYRKQKDPYVKKKIINAISQVYYRAQLSNRPSREWFDEQRQIIDSKIDKLEKTKSRNEK